KNTIMIYNVLLAHNRIQNSISTNGKVVLPLVESGIWSFGYSLQVFKMVNSICRSPNGTIHHIGIISIRSSIGYKVTVSFIKGIVQFQSAVAWVCVVYCFVSPVLNFGSAKGFAPHTHFAYVSIEVIVVMAFGNHKVGASSSIDNSSLRTGNIFQLAIYIKINAGYIIAIQYCGYVVPISVIYYRG